MYVFELLIILLIFLGEKSKVLICALTMELKFTAMILSNNIILHHLTFFRL